MPAMQRPILPRYRPAYSYPQLFRIYLLSPCFHKLCFLYRSLVLARHYGPYTSPFLSARFFKKIPWDTGHTLLVTQISLICVTNPFKRYWSRYCCFLIGIRFLFQRIFIEYKGNRMIFSNIFLRVYSRGCFGRIKHMRMPENSANSTFIRHLFSL